MFSRKAGKIAPRAPDRFSPTLHGLQCTCMASNERYCYRSFSACGALCAVSGSLEAVRSVITSSSIAPPAFRCVRASCLPTMSTNGDALGKSHLEKPT